MENENGTGKALVEDRGPYRKYSVSYKRELVELCLQPGASVAGIALAHGINANLVRKWIVKYRSGEYGGSDIRLVPVTVDEAVPRANLDRPCSDGGDHIEIDLPSARLRLHGRVDGETLRIVLGCLTR